MAKRKPMKPSTRFRVFQRDDFTCQYCGQSAPNVVLQVDHVVAVSSGGGNDFGNLVTACTACNSGKGARDGCPPGTDDDYREYGKFWLNLLKIRLEEQFGSLSRHEMELLMTFVAGMAKNRQDGFLICLGISHHCRNFDYWCHWADLVLNEDQHLTEFFNGGDLFVRNIMKEEQLPYIRRQMGLAQ